MINFDSFQGFWRNPEIQDGGPRWPPLKNDYVIPTSCEVINPFCGRQRKQFFTYYLPIKSYCHSFIGLEVLRGGGGGGGRNQPAPRLRNEKKPRLNRFKLGRSLAASRLAKLRGTEIVVASGVWLILFIITVGLYYDCNYMVLFVLTSL